MDEDDDAKRAANEATFREANERIREAEREFDPPLERAPFLCECDDVTCRELIPLTREEYEAVRRDPTLFAIVPGHSTRGKVVEEHDGAYLTVRKTGVGAAVARERDARDPR